MNRHLTMIALCLGITGCATTAPQAPQPASSAEVSGTNDADAGAAGQAASAERDGAAQASGGSAASGSDGEVEVLDTPEVPKVAVIPGQAEAADKNEKICRRERTTGTHRARRVCRTRAEIDRMAVEAKEVFEDLNRSQVEY